MKGQRTNFLYSQEEYTYAKWSGTDDGFTMTIR